MKKLLIIIPAVFLNLIINSSHLHLKLIEEKDYYRAAGAYKEYAYNNGIDDTAQYYLNLTAIYALSDFSDIAEDMYSTASYHIDEHSEIKTSALLRSYIVFSQSYYSDALFELESFFPEDDTLMASLKFFVDMLNKEDKVYLVPQYLPDSIKRDIDAYMKVSLKDPVFAVAMSSIYPGLGELYAGDYTEAIRDFTVSTVFIAATGYAFLKNRNAWNIDRPEMSWDYMKTRDWVLFYALYSFFVGRFKNGAVANAEEIAYEYNEDVYEEYLSGLRDYIDNLYRRAILDYLK
ncbi:MAG: hypothetical protein R6U31_00765 [bacterium]